MPAKQPSAAKVKAERKAHDRFTNRSLVRLRVAMAKDLETIATQQGQTVTLLQEISSQLSEVNQTLAAVLSAVKTKSGKDRPR